MKAKVPALQTEILVHNVSHSDLVLSCNDLRFSFKNDQIMARPKFSYFKEITEKILESTKSENELNIECRTGETFRHLASHSQSPRSSNRNQINCPLGINIQHHPVRIDDLVQLRFRRDDRLMFSSANNQGADVGAASDSCVIDAAHFPLLAILIPMWLQHVSTSQMHDPVVSTSSPASASWMPQASPNVRYIVYLITGRGTPADSSQRILDNSTECTGKLMELFLNKAYPHLEVIQVHSDNNLFKYEDNIFFASGELCPKIDRLRNELARQQGAAWRENFKVTISFADGSTARVSAINASLRHYKPTFMHFSQLKSFWTENKLILDDIEVHTFEEISTQPATKVDLEDTSLVGLVVREMVKFRDEFERVRRMEHDLSAFWLRKTKKPVLSVLLVQKENGEPKLYRGTNMEVSMPTGSLCAERNVIGSALADDMTLRRQDLKLIAVLAAGSIDDIVAETTAPALAPASAFASVVPATPNQHHDHDGTVSMWSGNDQAAAPTSPLMIHVNVDRADSGCDSFASASNGTSGTSSGSGHGSGSGIGEGTFHQSQSPTQKRKTKKIYRSNSTSSTGVVSANANAHAHAHANANANASTSTSTSADHSPVVSPGGAASYHSENASEDMDVGVDPIGLQRAMAMTMASDRDRDRDRERDTDRDRDRQRDGDDEWNRGRDRGLKRPPSNSLLDDGSGSANNTNNTNNTSNILVADRETSSASGSMSSRKVRLVTNSRAVPIPTSVEGTGSNTPAPLPVQPSAPAKNNFEDDDDSQVEMQVQVQVPHWLEACGVCSGPGGRDQTCLIEVEVSDINPLKPCGACHEWLKKIAEVNPQFSVITFTDYNCRGKYEEEIKD